MTLKLQAYQSRGIKTDKIIDEFEFCCWEDLFRWLKAFASLHKCKKHQRLSDALELKSPPHKA